jgi:hypothetical protein
MWQNEDQWLGFNNQFIFKIKKQNPVLFIRQKKTLFFSSSHDAMMLAGKHGFFLLRDDAHQRKAAIQCYVFDRIDV